MLRKILLIIFGLFMFSAFTYAEIIDKHTQQKFSPQAVIERLQQGTNVSLLANHANITMLHKLKIPNSRNIQLPLY